MSEPDPTSTSPPLDGLARPPIKSVSMADVPIHPRLVGIDVARAVALLGVVAMNYHGYLYGNPQGSFIDRVFNPWVGVLSTRFAATFVTVAGVGVVLLTARSRRSADPQQIDHDRWRLRRRGLLLLAGGFVLDWIWSGTILFFYGAYFITGSFIFTLRSRWLIAIGAASALAAQALQLWLVELSLDGRSADWLTSSSGGANASPRGLMFDVWINGTHPLLPWLAFFCFGMVLGRAVGSWSRWRRRLVSVGLLMIAGGYATSTILSSIAQRSHSPRMTAWLSNLSLTDPFSRCLLYVIVTVGSSLIAVILVVSLAERCASTAIIRCLGHAGRTTLTIYVLHILMFNLLVDWLGWIRPTGLDTAMGFAVAFWLIAVISTDVWHRAFGQGPLERLYRSFGG